MKKFDFTDFLESKKAISICLAIGVLFLVNTYQKIMFMIDPENIDLFTYPYFLRVILSHVDSLFFGFATIIIMFQSNKKSTKILYCTFESIMIFLNFNRNFITEQVGTSANVYIVTYISIFTGFTLFILGTLAKEHRKEKALQTAKDEAKQERQQEQERRQQQKQNNNFSNNKNKIGFDFDDMPKNETNKGGRPPITPEQKNNILNDLKKGLSVRKTAEKNNVSFRSVQNIKIGLKAFK